MEPETQNRFEELDQRLKQAERQILATGNLVSKAGIPWLVDTQVKVDALMESHARLYGTLQQLAESQKQLTESQRKTDGALQQLAESQKKTDERLDRLAATVQAFIDSMSKGGNGSRLPNST